MTATSTKTEKLLFWLSLATCLFWLLIQLVDVYHFKATGIFYEIVSIPMLLMLVVLPILLIVQLIRHKPKFRSLYLLSLSMLFVTLIILLLIG